MTITQGTLPPSSIGNSVCPPVARALVAANQPDLCNWQPEAMAA